MEAAAVAAEDSEDETPPQPPLTRSTTDGGIPCCYSGDLRIIEKSALNFDGAPPSVNKLWYGPTTFELRGEVWNLVKFLNYGGEGQTYMAIRKSTGKNYAIKFCNKMESLEVELLKKMPRALAEHANFLTYENILLDIKGHFAPAFHAIIMEYVPNGELFEFIASTEPSAAGKPVSEGTSRRFIRDVVSGMSECYRFGITHRDLKPENFLLNEEGRIVIIDMGHAKRSPPSQPIERVSSDDPPELTPVPLSRVTTTHSYGTEAFNAPEVGNGKSYDCELSDVWSIAVVAFMLHAKLPAFYQGGAASWHDVRGSDNAVFWQKIQACGFYQTFPDGLKQFINTLWQADPSDRPRFSNLDLAISGDEKTLAEYPGLRWLAEPLNTIDEFIGELRRAAPDKKFVAPNAPAATRW